MLNEDKIKARVKSLRLMLIKKAKDKGIYENFGQKEVMKLKDVFGYTSDIEAFENWCMNFSQKQLKEMV